MNTSEILNKAADVIEEQGWVTGSKGWDWEQGAGVCLEGGILAAMEVPSDSIYENVEQAVVFSECPAYVAVSNYLRETRNYTFRRIFWFNDGAKDASEVIEVLRAAALVEAVKEAETAKEEVTV